MNDKEIQDILILSENGFTPSEIARLQQLRRDYHKFSSPSDSETKHKFMQRVEAAKQARYGLPYPEWTKYE